MYLAVQHFRFFIEGRPFMAFTDHKPLTCMAKVAEPWSNRQVRHIVYISEYMTDIQHVEGINNPEPEADALSHVLILAVNSSVGYTEMARCQQQDADETLAYQQQSPASGGRTYLFQQFYTALRHLDLQCTIHGHSHSGANTTVKLVSSKFVCHGLSKQVRAWAKTCLDCQPAKVHHHIRASLETFVVPPQRFAHVHVDLVKPLPPSRGYTYLLTVVDRFMENTLLEKFGKACKDNTEIYSIPQ